MVVFHCSTLFVSVNFCNYVNLKEWFAWPATLMNGISEAVNVGICVCLPSLEQNLLKSFKVFILLIILLIDVVSSII